MSVVNINLKAELINPKMEIELRKTFKFEIRLSI